MTASTFAGPSEMHARVSALDWAATPVGAPETWPKSLRATVRTLLASRYPMVLTWGPEFTQFYNDAYSALIGDKHPAALGEDIRVTLAEGWDALEPLIRGAMETGVASWVPALLLPLERAGYREEAYFSVSHAPAEDDEGRVVGMLAVCSEVTQQVLGERRMRLLRDLALRAGEPRGADATARSVCATLAEHPLDLPFALLYLRDAAGALALAGAVGVEPGHPAAPRHLPADAGEPWPLARAAGGEVVRVHGVERRVEVAGGALGDPVREALALPLAGTGPGGALGVLVAGISPSRALDEGYASFFELLRGQVSVALRNARAYEEERRRAEELAELDRAKTEFFANVSHEFRTPLTLLLGPLEEALRGGHELAPALRTELGAAHRNALRLLKLVNTLLDFSRLEAGRAEAHFEPVELGALTAELASGFRSATERAGLRLVVDAPPLPTPVYVDRDLWEKVVLNLLSNAVKHTFEGEIEVRVRAVEGQAELSVRDTGVGIAPDEIPHLFERFHRVRGARSRTHEGTGIGLALVREVARLHGGDVRVRSALDEGTVFTVAVPMGDAHLPAGRVGRGRSGTALGARPFADEALRWLPIASGEPADERIVPPTGPRVLVADDNGDMRAYVTRLLRAEGYRVEAVADGVSALEAARAEPPDLVLTDVMMPRLDGFGLLRALRGDPATATVPVVMLSARAGEESRVEGLRAGADDYLAKPFSARELRARVAANLELVRLRALSARRERELHAERAVSEAKTRFLTTMSHELRTPLNAIAGYVELLEMGVRGPVNDAQRADLERIRQAQRHLLGLIDEVLDYARVEGGRVEYAREPVALDAVIAAAEPLAAPWMSAAGVRLRVDPSPCAATADADRVRQILLNLLSNAAKFTPSGGLVSVRCERAGDRVRLHVADTGPGIPAERLEAVFEPFVQLGRSFAAPVEGAGLGLATARRMARAMGGDLTAASTPGQGSVFTLALPAA